MHRPAGGRSAGARRPGRRRARHRYAGARRHLRPPAAAREEARSRGHHGLDTDAPERRNQLEGARAGRNRLCSQAGDQPRHHYFDRVPTRADRKDRGARRPPQAAPRRGLGPAPDCGPPSRIASAARRSAADRAASVLHHSPARAPGRRLDRRPAGAASLGPATRRRVRPRSGADHAAHAAHVHYDHGRASRAGERPAGARAERRRAGSTGNDLSRARRTAHAGQALRPAAGRRPRRRASRQFLPARSRSAVRLGGEGLGRCGAGVGPHRHGRGRCPGCGRDRGGGRQRRCARRNQQRWGMPGAVARAGLCSAVLPLDRIAPKLVELCTEARS